MTTFILFIVFIISFLMTTIFSILKVKKPETFNTAKKVILTISAVIMFASGIWYFVSSKSDKQFDEIEITSADIPVTDTVEVL